jgi:hypothetical protein
MPIFLTDAEIAVLIAERKPLPSDYQAQMRLKPKRGHKERELDLKGGTGNEFRLVLRQSLFNPLDFSVILVFRPPKTNEVFRLRRYNGKSHEHTNAIERQTFYDFHVHTATERYVRDSGLEEDAFAEPTDRYGDFTGAISCMLNDCGFEFPAGSIPDLFSR